MQYNDQYIQVLPATKKRWLLVFRQAIVVELMVRHTFGLKFGVVNIGKFVLL